MRKQLLWLGGLFLCLAVLGLVVVLTYRDLVSDHVTPGVTPENFKRLYAGMSEREAEAILGRPTDGKIYKTGNHYSIWRENGMFVIQRVSDICFLEDDQPDLIEGQIHLPDGTMIELREPQKESTSDQFRQWLGLK